MGHGRVTVLGNRFGACDVRELRTHVGWVSSSLEHKLPPRLPVMDVVMSGIDASIGVYRVFTETERLRAGTALAAVGVEALAQQPYGLLSQGEQQRVLIARALAAEPKLLILDEPCAGLDPAARNVFLDDMAALSRESGAPTLILVTHHIEEIGDWIDRVLAIKDGRVCAEGAPAEVLNDATMSEVFAANCTVTHDGARRWIRVTGTEQAR